MLLWKRLDMLVIHKSIREGVHLKQVGSLITLRRPLISRQSFNKLGFNMLTLVSPIIITLMSFIYWFINLSIHAFSWWVFTFGCLYILIIIHCSLFILISIHTVQITFIFIDFRVCDFAFAFKTQNAPCVSRFKRVLFSDRFQFAF